MSAPSTKDPFIIAQVMELVIREREHALSPREWQHRLAGYGYAVRETDEGHVVETLPHHIEIGLLPEEAPAAAH
ncbi:hypothetical protein [uncultured Sulfitobacter sp.]|uniref:hypothetical protein n=1 Tax=uncultured Sulfitobacter sp. TaxID=191468 RepID=UPI00261B88B6|nr:hypothetical protein [uncultured Sulfitobacter sp.]